MRVHAGCERELCVCTTPLEAAIRTAVQLWKFVARLFTPTGYNATTGAPFFDAAHDNIIFDTDCEAQSYNQAKHYATRLC